MALLLPDEEDLRSCSRQEEEAPSRHTAIANREAFTERVPGQEIGSAQSRPAKAAHLITTNR